MLFTTQRHPLCALVLFVALALAAPHVASAQTVQLNPARDNTLYENATGSLSNGAGATLYAGKTGSNNQYLRRRAAMAFDLTSIPTGSTITAASLTVQVTRSNGTLNETFTLNPLTADWGEGSSNAGSPGGAGAASAVGDATWIHRFYNTNTWATPGGDFASTVSASQAIAGAGTYVFSSAQMIADLQGWLDNPAGNFGWIVRGDETLPDGTLAAKEFASRENLNAAFRPTLSVSYVPEPALVGPAAVALLALARRRR